MGHFERKDDSILVAGVDRRAPIKRVRVALVCSVAREETSYTTFGFSVNCDALFVTMQSDPVGECIPHGEREREREREEQFLTQG